MCTTMMVLTTIALILRQRFSNKIKPVHCALVMYHLPQAERGQRSNRNREMTG
uniref:Uncharacterized protein n=1 Tax=Maylandia zebra TaxID=106582 RepID=A0A3P9BMR0_9CICH